MLLYLLNSNPKVWRPCRDGGASTVGLSAYAYDKAIRELKVAGYIRVTVRPGAKDAYDYRVAETPDLLPAWDASHGTVKGGAQPSNINVEEQVSNLKGRNSTLIFGGLNKIKEQDQEQVSSCFDSNTHSLPVTSTYSSSNSSSNKDEKSSENGDTDTNSETVSVELEDEAETAYWAEQETYAPWWMEAKIEELDKFRVEALDSERTFLSKKDRELVLAEFNSQDYGRETPTQIVEYLANLILGASHDPKPGRRRAWSTWEDILGRRDLFEFWYVLFEDEPAKDEHSARRQYTILFNRGLKPTDGQVSKIKLRHPMVWSMRKKNQQEPEMMYA